MNGETWDKISEIVNDENVMTELEQKVKDFEQEIIDFEQKRRDMEQNKRDLEQKRRDLEQQQKDLIEIGDDGDMEYFTETIAEINSQIDAKGVEIMAVTAQIMNKGEKIKAIANEFLGLPAEPFEPLEPLAPLPPMAPLFPAAPAESEFDKKIEAIDEKMAEFEKNFVEPAEKFESEHDRKIRGFEEKYAECERLYAVFEKKYAKLEETYNTIERKMNENISEATRERLEEMMGEIEEKMGEIEEHMGEIEERMGEIEEEREEYEHGYIDEDIINEIKSLPGFEENDDRFEASDEKEKISEINIKIIDEMEREYGSVSKEQREQRRRYKRESKYNVNFCSGAKIDSYCCANSNDERPENLIDDDPSLKTKWCATQNHRVEIAHPYWVIIDLGSVKSFNYVQIIKSSDGRSYNGDIGNKSFDMSAWRIEVCQNQLEKTNNIWREFNRETNDKSSVYERQFEPVTGRYIRLLIDAGESDPNNKHGRVRLHCFKIKMRDETGEEIEDFTRKAEIESCSHYDKERPENILNDNMKQKWYATHRHFDRVVMPHWIIIDFGESRIFNHLRMVKASEACENHDSGRHNLNMSAWRFEVSEDKENWTEFNRETNDQSSIYIKAFEQQTGRYVRLWVDAAERDPNHKNGHVRIYDLRIEMRGETLNDKTVTFDDIIAIAPFAKKETLDKLADKLTDIDNFAKIKEVGKFLSAEAINKLILKAFEKDDFNAIFALAPYASKDIIAKIALDLDSELEFDKIKALSPFLGKEAITGIILSGGQMDMQKLRELAPFLGSALIDEIVQRMF